HGAGLAFCLAHQTSHDLKRRLIGAGIWRADASLDLAMLVQCRGFDLGAAEVDADANHGRPKPSTLATAACNSGQSSIRRCFSGAAGAIERSLGSATIWNRWTAGA